jgi:plasmid replication initiation protein
MRHRTRHEREQLELFRALPGDLAPRDARDLMAYPFFSLANYWLRVSGFADPERT